MTLPSQKEALAQDFKDLLTAACNFQARNEIARNECRETFKTKESDTDSGLRILIDGQIAGLEAWMSEPVAALTTETSYQIGLCASFVRSHFIINDLILCGDIIEAATLVRKQLESLARLNELDQLPLSNLHGRTPNISSVFRHGEGRMYGTLSEVAHFSTPRVSELMHVIENGDRIGPSLQPVFTEHCFACFDMHHFVCAYFLAWIVPKLVEWYPHKSTAREETLMIRTFMLAESAGIIQLPG
jgi:hypothetical protein